MSKCIGQTKGYPVIGLDGVPMLCPVEAAVQAKEEQERRRKGRIAARQFLTMSAALMVPPGRML